MSDTNIEKKYEIVEKFTGKPEDIKRLHEVQRRMIEIGKRLGKKKKAA